MRLVPWLGELRAGEGLGSLALSIIKSTTQVFNGSMVWAITMPCAAS